MYNEKIEALINAALADGELTEKEKQILFKRAEEEGIDLDEFEMVLDARLYNLDKTRQSDPKMAAPKSDKFGDIKKCPACGAIVASYKGKCDDCGYEFENIQANSTSTLLADKLLRETDVRKKIEIIETFPIPITKADLIEFLTSLKPRILGEYSELTDAYLKKYQECVEKSKVAFSNDKQILPFVAELENIEKYVKSVKTKKAVIKCMKWAKEHWIITSIATFFLFAVVSAVVDSISHLGDDKTIELIQSKIDNGELDEATQRLYNAEIPKKELAIVLIEKYIEKNDITNALYVYEKVTHNHCDISRVEAYGHDYELQATKLISQALIKSGDYDKAWDYSPRKYDTPTYAGNAQSYYQFMMEVVTYLCQNSRKQEAKKFIETYSEWFEKYVDNGEWGKDYMEYSYAKAKAKLLNVLNRY